MRKKHTGWGFPAVIGGVILLGLAAIGRGGNLEPPAPPSSTMHTLEDIYQAVQTVTQFQFLGTTAAVTPDIGYFGMTRQCQAQFGVGTRICTSLEIVETVALPSPTAWQSDQAWARPVVVGVSGSLDPINDVSFWSLLEASGQAWRQGPTGSLDCSGWSQSSNTGRAGVLLSRGSGFEARIGFGNCTETAGVACCGPVP